MWTRKKENPYMTRIMTQGDGATIVPTRKRLMISDIEQVFEDVLAQIEAGRRHIVLDFSEVQWVCASTAGFLLELKRRLARQGGSLRLRALPEEMRQVLKLVHGQDWFDIEDPLTVLNNAC